MYASWEEDSSNIMVEQPDAETDKKKDFKLDAQLRFLNCIDQDKDESEEWYHVLTLEDSSIMKPSCVSEHKLVRVMLCQRVQGWFSEGFRVS